MPYYLFQSGPTLQCASIERIQQLGQVSEHITVFLKPPEPEALAAATSSAFSHAYYEHGVWHRMEDTHVERGEKNRESPSGTWWRKVPVLRSIFGKRP